MKIMLETTVWDDPGVPNHVYVFNDSLSHAIAYVRAGTKEVFKFKRPMGIDRRGRTFVELEDEEPVKEAPKPDQWEFVGSKGDRYLVTREPGGGLDYRCTCPGFTYRGSCKHTAEKIMEHSYDIR